MCRDTNKFLELLKPEYNNALRYCRALCAAWSPDDAEDVLQQALLNAFESFNSLNDTEKFRSWFFKIITRVFYSSVRKHFWKKFIPMDNVKKDIPEVYPRSGFSEDRIILDKALSKLTYKERAAILLFEVAEFSAEEIRLMQNENSLSAVKSRLSRARKKLKRYITGLEQESTLSTPDKWETNSARNLFTGSESFGGEIENETIKLAAELRTKK